MLPLALKPARTTTYICAVVYTQLRQQGFYHDHAEIIRPKNDHSLSWLDQKLSRKRRKLSLHLEPTRTKKKEAVRIVH